MNNGGRHISDLVRLYAAKDGHVCQSAHANSTPGELQSVDAFAEYVAGDAGGNDCREHNRQDDFRIPGQFVKDNYRGKGRMSSTRYHGGHPNDRVCTDAVLINHTGLVEKQSESTSDTRAHEKRGSEDPPGTTAAQSEAGGQQL